MKKLIKQAKLIHPGDELNGHSIDILIDDKVILEVSKTIENSKADEVIDERNLILLPGLVDMQCSIGEPGEEDKEDLHSATMAAAKGGYTHICMLPSTFPTIDNKATLTGILSRASNSPVNVLVYGAISKGLRGEELSEMFDLNDGGAIGFSDGKNPVKDSNMMKRALEYAKSFDGLVCSFPYDERINPGGMVNESLENLMLGLKSVPALAEEIMLVRDLYLTEYVGSKLHVSTISTANSVKLIAEAKQRGVNVTCGVALPNLLYTESELHSFDTNYKTTPPLRSEEDRKALINGVASGIIDVIVSDHTPEIIENKDCEFDFATFGMISLETALSSLYQQNELSLDTMAKALSLNPRKVLNLRSPELKTGNPFDFTVFNSTTDWIYNDLERKSKSANSPLINKTLKGRVVTL